MVKKNTITFTFFCMITLIFLKYSPSRKGLIFYYKKVYSKPLQLQGEVLTFYPYVFKTQNINKFNSIGNNIS